jgi:hypothetical protein
MFNCKTSKKDRLGDLDLDVSIVLKWSLNEYGMQVWIEYN